MAVQQGLSANIKRKTLTDQTFDVLKGMILDRKLLPGEQLNIAALGKQLGVSSSPLREALVRLEGQQLLVQKLYCGYLVADEPTPKYFSDLIDYRTVVEGYAASLGAPKNDSAILAALQENYAYMAETKQIGQSYEEYKDFIEADAAFHELIVASAGNDVIIDTYRNVNVILVQSRLYHNKEPTRERHNEVMTEHRGILDAFEAGDGNAARSAIEKHLLGGRRRLLGGI